MVGEWREVALGEILKVKHGSAFKGEFFTDEPLDTVLVTPGNFAIGGGFQDGKRKYYNGPVPEDYVLKPGQVVVTMTDLSKESDTLGYAAIIPNDSTIWLHNQRVGLLEFKPGIPASPRFIQYLLRTYEYRSWVTGSATGTTVKHTSPGRIESFVTLIPPIEEQHAIAKILGTLDDKIELNRRTNETLEAMARALFKAWCVDFEPVRAKLEGRWQRGESLPGLPAHLYDLFPARLIESEWGEIPEGWRVDSLGKVAVHLRRSVQPSEIKDETSYIALEHMPKRCIALAEWGVANGIESNKYEFKQGEILFGKLRPYFHKVGVAPVDGVCSTDIVVIAPILPTWFGFVLVHVSSDAFVEYTNAGSTGTKMPRTSWSEMAQYPVVLPHEDVAVAFNQHIQALSEEIIIKIHESRSLVQLRDTLLPKLISGELRVPDAERITGAAL
ncbi:restriction endonuclease subunit S [Xylella fastidiosa]|uniref:restriction endonuclease subunit S n=1 Tax=Xylella fastidiosa TaxID=2371 RepID=UPI0003D2CCB1|nr:restriction endonuclease subunit S [Xylella fastidiosa]ALR05188.1 restriction endonuclease subunit S [Xylella fastidiosa]KXB22325.1 type I restriction endonuclease subunit S [Xylella fastidiosa]OJZ69370.1 type I restriction endonuclease subunit S [Xylella fastidiosa 6c]